MKTNQNETQDKNIMDDVVINKVIAKDYEGLKALIASKHNLEGKDSNGHTPLGVALIAGDFAAAHALLDAGADVKPVDKLGLTIMHIVVRSCENYTELGSTQEEIFVLVRKLVEKGAVLNYQDRRGNTPINIVAQRAKPSKSTAELYTRLGKLLLSIDVDSSNTIQLRNNMGKSPLDYLVKNGNFLLRDAVYEKLPHVQDKLNQEARQREWEVNKFIALDKPKEIVK